VTTLTAFQNASRTGLRLDDLHFVLQAEWGARHAGHRGLIREDVIRTLSNRGLRLTREQLELFRDLDHPPTHPDIAISISHCRALGGYAWTTQPGLIGFDIEETSRINPKTAERISVPEEFSQAPSPAVLWVAKEAAFKALAAAARSTAVSEMRIADWRLSAPLESFWLFNVSAPAGEGHFERAHGLAGLENGFAAAVVFSPPHSKRFRSTMPPSTPK